MVGPHIDNISDKIHLVGNTKSVGDHDYNSVPVHIKVPDMSSNKLPIHKDCISVEKLNPLNNAKCLQ